MPTGDGVEYPSSNCAKRSSRLGKIYAIRYEIFRSRTTGGQDFASPLATTNDLEWEGMMTTGGEISAVRNTIEWAKAYLAKGHQPESPFTKVLFCRRNSTAK